MGLNWNPNYPEQAGVERRDIGYGGAAVNTPSRWQALRFTARHTGPISNIDIMSSEGSQAPVLGSPYKEQQCPMVLDLYPASGAPWLAPPKIVNDVIGATAVTGQPTMFNEDLSQPITVSRIQTIGDGLYIAASQFPQQGFWVQFDTAAFPLNRRILGVRVIAHVSTTWGLVRSDSQPFTPGNHTFGIVKDLSTGGVLYTDFVHVGEVLVDHAAPASPDGWSWWTPQMIRDMRSGGPRAFKLEAWGFGWHIGYVALQVFYHTEDRIGVGVRPPSTNWNYTTFPMKTPAATGNPSVTSGQEYAAILRVPYEQSSYQVGRATMSWRRLNGAPVVSGWDNVTDTFTTQPYNFAGGVPAFRVMNPAQPIEPATLNAIMCTGGPHFSGGTALETSQPYVFSRGAHIYQEGSTQITATQTITVTGSGNLTTFGQTSAMIGWNPSSPPLPTMTIRAEVWTATGAPEVRVFSPVERTFTDVSRMIPATDFFTGDENWTMRLVRWRHPESTTLLAGKYQIILSTTNTPKAREWRVEAMSGHVHFPDQTFGRSTDVGIAFINDAFSTLGPITGPDAGGIVTWAGDLQATIMAVPPAVTGVATAVGYTTAHHTEVCGGIGNCHVNGCADQGAPFVQITWSATSDTLSVRYEIQRSDDYDPTWRSVALVQGRFNNIWKDYESRIGVRTLYRIRSIRADDIAGDWSDSAIITLDPGQVALTFTSNAATGLAVTASEAWEGSDVERNFTFQEYDDVTFRPIYGRERQVAFHPTERRGITFSRLVLMNALCTINPPTLRLYNPIRILTWAPIPYVCVRDGEGNRWFANVQVPEARNNRPGERWFAEIVITEVSATPAVNDTGVEQITEEDTGQL